MYENRQFAIFSTTELPLINFGEVLETSADTVRTSNDGTKSFIKWAQAPYDPTPYEIVNPETNETETITPEPPGPPAFIADIESAEGPYTYAEILEILSGPEWTKPMEDM